MASPEQLEDEILIALRRIIRAVDLRSRQTVRECGLTGPQLLVLRETARLGGAPIGALARAVNLGQPTVSGILDRLEQRELVRRHRSETDRRTVMVLPTPAGARALQSAPSLLQDTFRSQLLRREEWEQTQILATLQRIAAMMDAGDLEAAPVLDNGPIGSGGGVTAADSREEAG